MDSKSPRLPILETGRLRLEPIVAEDAEWIFPMMADREVMAFWDVPEIDDPDVIASIVAGQAEEMAQGRGAYWAIRTLPDAVTAYAAANGLRRLLARTHLGNRRSDTLLERLGFQEEGILRGHVERDGERRDCRLFGLLL